MIDTITDFFCGSVLALFVWFFGGIDSLLLVLFAFCVINCISKMLAACRNHEIDNGAGFWELAKKCMIFMFVGMAHLLDNTLGNYFPSFASETGTFRPIVTLFYILDEGRSTFENAEKLGVPIPSPLHSLLAKLHKLTQSNETEHKPENNEPPKLPVMRSEKENDNDESKQEDSEDSEVSNINHDTKQNKIESKKSA